MILSNQYYMYGIIMPYDWYKNWLESPAGTLQDIMNNFDLREINDDDDISAVFYGRDNKSIIVGKIIEKFEDVESFVINELSVDEQEEIKASVKNNYGLIGEFNHYFIKTFYTI